MNQSRRILAAVIGWEPLRIEGAARLAAVLETAAIVADPPRLIRRPLEDPARLSREPQPGIAAGSSSGSCPPSSTDVLKDGPTTHTVAPREPLSLPFRDRRDAA
jgi:hypothetical protein